MCKKSMYIKDPNISPHFGGDISHFLCLQPTINKISVSQIAAGCNLNQRQKDSLCSVCLSYHTLCCLFHTSYHQRNSTIVSVAQKSSHQMFDKNMAFNCMNREYFTES